jgi:hypothetical protein
LLQDLLQAPREQLCNRSCCNKTHTVTKITTVAWGFPERTMEGTDTGTSCPSDMDHWGVW